MEMRKIIIFVAFMTQQALASGSCSAAGEAQKKTDTNVKMVVEKTATTQKTQEEYEKLYPNMAQFEVSNGFFGSGYKPFFQAFLSKPSEYAAERAQQLKKDPFLLMKTSSLYSLIDQLLPVGLWDDVLKKPIISTSNEIQVFADRELVDEQVAQEIKNKAERQKTVILRSFPLLGIPMTCNGKKLVFWQAWEPAITNADKNVVLECLLNTLNSSKGPINSKIISHIAIILNGEKFLPYIQKNLQDKLEALKNKL